MTAPVVLTFGETVEALDRLVGLPVNVTIAAGGGQVPVAGCAGALFRVEPDFADKVLGEGVDSSEARVYYVHGGQDVEHWPWLVVRRSSFVEIGRVEEPNFCIGWACGYVVTMVSLACTDLWSDAPAGARE